MSLHDETSRDSSCTKATTNALLRNPDKIGEYLNLADKYSQAYAAEPKMFLLPAAHSFLKPIITAYAHNLEGFTHYLTTVRDLFDRNSAQWLIVQRVYRRVNGRYVQQLRRERSHRAVVKAIELYGSVDYQVRMQWVANLENEWAKRRVVFLDANRSKFKGGRIPVEERVEMLAEFWNDIDTEIYEGRLKKWH